MTNFYDMAYDAYSFDQDKVTIQEGELEIITGNVDLDPFLARTQYEKENPLSEFYRDDFGPYNYSL